MNQQELRLLIRVATGDMRANLVLANALSTGPTALAISFASLMIALEKRVLVRSAGRQCALSRVVRNLGSLTISFSSRRWDRSSTPMASPLCVICWNPSSILVPPHASHEAQYDWHVMRTSTARRSAR